MQRRRRVNHQFTLRIIAWAKEVREQAAELPPGADRDALLKKVRQTEAALHLEDWVSPTGLHSTKEGRAG
jgi:hypothetical protein